LWAPSQNNKTLGWAYLGNRHSNESSTEKGYFREYIISGTSRLNPESGYITGTRFNSFSQGSRQTCPEKSGLIP